MTCFAENMIQVMEDEQKLFESVLKINMRKAEILRESQILNEDDNVRPEFKDAQDAEVKPAPAEEAPKSEEKPAEDNKDNAVNDAVKKNIIQRVGATLQRIGEAIKSAFEKLLTFLKRVFMSDSKVTTKYISALEKNGSLEGFEGIKNFYEPNLDFEFPEGALEQILTPFTAGNAIAASLVWTRDITSEAESIITGCNNAGKEVELWNANGSANFDWRKAINKLSNGKIGKELFKTVKQMAGVGKLGQAIINKTSDITAKINGEAALDAEAPKKYTKNMIDACKAVVNTSKKYFIAIRRALIVCGTYALKKTGAEASDDKFNAPAVIQAAADMSLMADIANESYIDGLLATI